MTVRHMGQYKIMCKLKWDFTNTIEIEQYIDSEIKESNLPKLYGRKHIMLHWIFIKTKIYGSSKQY